MSQAAPQLTSGFYATATIGASPYELPIERWTCQPSAEMVVFKNSRSGPVVRRQSTFTDVRVTLYVDYDSSTSIYDLLLAGQTASTIKLYLDQSSRYSGTGTGTGSLDGSYWSFTSLLVESMPQDAMVAGKISQQITLLGNGSITYPS